MSIEIKIADGRSELYQWDTERMFNITADSVVTEVHFAIGKTDSALTCKPTLKSEDGTFKYTVTIPNAVLQKSGLLFVYLYLADNSGGQTIHCVKFRVVPKPKPNDYPTVEDELNEKIAKKGDTLDYSDNILSLLSGENVLSKVEVGNLTELDLSAYTEDNYLTIDNDVFNDFEIGIVSKSGYFGDTFGTVISLPFADDMEKELEDTFNEKQVFELGKGTIIAVNKPSSEFSEYISRILTIINGEKIRTVFLANSSATESLSMFSAVSAISDTGENANMAMLIETETYNFPYYLYNLREKIISNKDELTNSLNIYLDSIYNKLAKKQDSLTAGDGIKLDNSKISVETDNLDVSNSKATATVDGTEQTKTLSEMLGMVMSSSSGVTDYTKLDNLPYKVITADMLNNGKLDLMNLSTGAYQLLTGAKIICSENTVIDDLDVELIAGSLLFISDYDVSSNTHNLSYHGDAYSGFIENYEHYTMPEYDNNQITSGLISEANPTLYMTGSDVCNDLLNKQDAKNIVYSIDEYTNYRITLKTTDFYSTDTHRINEYRFQKILSKLTFAVPTSGAGNNGYLDSEIGFDIKFISGATATSIVQTANPSVEIYWYGDDTIAETTSNTTTSLFQPQPNKFYHVKIRREVIGWVCEVKSVDYIPTTENGA